MEFVSQQHFHQYAPHFLPLKDVAEYMVMLPALMLLTSSKYQGQPSFFWHAYKKVGLQGLTWPTILMLLTLTEATDQEYFNLFVLY